MGALCGTIPHHFWQHQLSIESEGIAHGKAEEVAQAERGISLSCPDHRTRATYCPTTATTAAAPSGVSKAFS
jgi:hypothetical protein